MPFAVLGQVQDLEPAIVEPARAASILGSKSAHVVAGRTLNFTGALFLRKSRKQSDAIKQADPPSNILYGFVLQDGTFTTHNQPYALVRFDSRLFFILPPNPVP